jgi:pimeloyl-ACP methyl ester carboxylesterase
MQETAELLFDWIGRNESILSGLVAVFVLISLIWAGIRRLTQKRDGDPLEAKETVSKKARHPQQIRYCRTIDKKRIAYAITGNGSPIVRSLGWFTNLELEWSSAVGRSFWEHLGANHQLIRYDGRGVGLSEKTSEFSAETRLNDLEAVVEASNIDRFILLGSSEGCRTAIRYAVAHPERLSHLVLYGPATPRKIGKEEVGQSKSFYSLISTGWARPSHSRFFADLFLGENSSQEELDYFQAMQTGSASAEVAATYFKSIFEDDDIFELANKITVPTLVVHPRDDQMCPFEWGRALAAEIPNAQLVPLEGDCHWALMNNDQSEEYINAIESFVDHSS